MLPLWRSKGCLGYDDETGKSQVYIGTYNASKKICSGNGLCIESVCECYEAFTGSSDVITFSGRDCHINKYYESLLFGMALLVVIITVTLGAMGFGPKNSNSTPKEAGTRKRKKNSDNVAAVKQKQQQVMLVSVLLVIISLSLKIAGFHVGENIGFDMIWCLQLMVARCLTLPSNKEFTNTLFEKLAPFVISSSTDKQFQTGSTWNTRSQKHVNAIFIMLFPVSILSATTHLALHRISQEYVPTEISNVIYNNSTLLVTYDAGFKAFDSNLNLTSTTDGFVQFQVESNFLRLTTPAVLIAYTKAAIEMVMCLLQLAMYSLLRFKAKSCIEAIVEVEGQLANAEGTSESQALEAGLHAFVQICDNELYYFVSFFLTNMLFLIPNFFGYFGYIMGFKYIEVWSIILWHTIVAIRGRSKTHSLHGHYLEINQKQKAKLGQSDMSSERARSGLSLTATNP